MKRSTILAALAALLCLVGCLGTPDSVKALHREVGDDTKTVLSVYARRVRGIVAATPEEEAAKQRELLALENLAKRIVEGLDGVGDYLDAAGLFASDAERAEFFALIREIHAGVNQ